MKNIKSRDLEAPLIDIKIATTVKFSYHLKLQCESLILLINVEKPTILHNSILMWINFKLTKLSMKNVL